MGMITEGNSATVALGVDDIITVVAPDGAVVQVENPAGTLVWEGSGVRSFGPVPSARNVKLTAASRSVYYEVSDLSDRQESRWATSEGKSLVRPDGSTLDLSWFTGTSDLPVMSAADLATTDLLTVVDTSASTTKSITVESLQQSLGTLIDAGGPLVGSFSWDTSRSSPAAVGDRAGKVTAIHAAMRRCVVNDAGVRQYYLSDTDSTKKADGTAAALGGADGQVMVEIPKFWIKLSQQGTIVTWSISAVPLAGYSVHPAFVKDGVEVDYRYVGAYHACVYSSSAESYISGTNLDDASSLISASADKLASVSGVYPMVGLTRSQFRTLAANRGAFWRQLDFTLWSAVQLLYVIEHQSFYSQNITGAGNTAGGYIDSSSNQNDSPHTVAGASNGRGNGSTNTTTGAGVNAKPGTSYMSYRGIENLYGNCWTFADGININVGAAGRVYVTNNRAHFADDTSSNMTLITSAAATGANYASAVAALDAYFIPTSVTGGSSSTYLTDYWYGTTSTNRVAFVGGSAYDGAAAGAFCVYADLASSLRYRTVGARLAG